VAFSTFFIQGLHKPDRFDIITLVYWEQTEGKEHEQESIFKKEADCS
jgi:hypothetical protein